MSLIPVFNRYLALQPQRKSDPRAVFRKLFTLLEGRASWADGPSLIRNFSKSYGWICFKIGQNEDLIGKNHHLNGHLDPIFGC